MTPERECLDAETLAAWMDGGLDQRAVAATEAHVSNCARCQALVATFAKTLPQEIVAPARVWRWWMAPIAAGAVAVTVWMVLPAGNQDAGSGIREETQIAVARDSVTAQPPLEAPETVQVFKAPPLAAPADARPAAPATRDRAAENAAAAAREAASPAAAAPPAATAGFARMRAEIAPVEVASPDPASRWRAGTGTIERSEDGGATWATVRNEPGEIITAAVASSPTVAWFVGRRGLVLLTTDGTTFARLPFPEEVDLVAVSATDTGSATVTTADGRTFQTQDGGGSWRRP